MANKTRIQAHNLLIDEAQAKVDAMEQGVKLPTLTTPGAAADLRSGKQLIDGSGNAVTGTMPDVAVPTPSISVSSAGLITASNTQSAGYTAGGTKSGTKQLTVQAAQTITPGTSDKTIASGRYLTGTQTIKGDANLKAENIKEGVSIFGVTGSLAAGGSGGADNLRVEVIDFVPASTITARSGGTFLCETTIEDVTAIGCIRQTTESSYGSGYKALVTNEMLSHFGFIDPFVTVLYTDTVVRQSPNAGGFNYDDYDTLCVKDGGVYIGYSKKATKFVAGAKYTILIYGE